MGNDQSVHNPHDLASFSSQDVWLFSPPKVDTVTSRREAINHASTSNATTRIPQSSLASISSHNTPSPKSRRSGNENQRHKTQAVASFQSSATPNLSSIHLSSVTLVKHKVSPPKRLMVESNHIQSRNASSNASPTLRHRHRRKASRASITALPSSSFAKLSSAIPALSSDALIPASALLAKSPTTELRPTSISKVIPNPSSLRVVSRTRVSQRNKLNLTVRASRGSNSTTRQAIVNTDDDSSIAMFSLQEESGCSPILRHESEKPVRPRTAERNDSRAEIPSAAAFSQQTVNVAGDANSAPASVTATEVANLTFQPSHNASSSHRLSASKPAVCPPPAPPLLDCFIPPAPSICAPLLSSPPSFSSKLLVANKPSQLRKLHWQTIDDLNDTIFSNVEDAALDLNLLNSTFSLESASRPKADVKQAPKTRYTLIDARRAQNIAIVLARLRMNAEEICMSILSADEKVVRNEEKLLMLLSIAPNADELASIQRVRKDILASLTDSEKLLVSLSRISALPLRLEMFMFALTFPRDLLVINQSLQTIHLACTQTRSSAALRSWFAAILKTGNALNGHQAVGFRLRSLSHLMQAKAKDASTTVLHFIVKTMRDHSGESINTLKTELCSLANAAAVDSKSLDADLCAIASKMHAARKLQAQLSTSGACATLTFVEQFLHTSAAEFEVTEKQYKALLSTTAALSKWLGEPEWSSDMFFREIVSWQHEIESIDAALNAREARLQRMAPSASKRQANTTGADENDRFSCNVACDQIVNKTSTTFASTTSKSERQPFSAIL